MTDKEMLINRGSTTAKNGFKNEDFTITEFNFKTFTTIRKCNDCKCY